MTVKLIRIDDRLIHGQVVMTWISYSESNSIYIIDNKVAKDDFLIDVLRSVAPSGIELKVFDEQQAQAGFAEWIASPRKIMILVRSPVTLVNLMNGKAEFKTVFLGGLGIAPGKRNLFRNISVSDEERIALKKLLDAGIEVFIQMLATERRSVLTKEMLN